MKQSSVFEEEEKNLNCINLEINVSDWEVTVRLMVHKSSYNKQYLSFLIKM